MDDLRGSILYRNRPGIRVGRLRPDSDRETMPIDGDSIDTNSVDDRKPTRVCCYGVGLGVSDGDSSGMGRSTSWTTVILSACAVRR